MTQYIQHSLVTSAAAISFSAFSPFIVLATMLSTCPRKERLLSNVIPKYFKQPTLLIGLSCKVIIGTSALTILLSREHHKTDALDGLMFKLFSSDHAITFSTAGCDVQGAGHKSLP